MLDITMDERITDSTCCFTLEININNFMETVAECRKGFFLWPLGNTGEAVIQTIGRSILRENKRSIVLPPATMASLKTEGTAVNETFINYINPLLQEEGVFPPFEVDKILVFHPDENGQMAFIYILINCPLFSQQKKILQKFLRNSRAVVIAAFELNRERSSQDQHNGLFLMARNLLLHLGDFNELMNVIIMEARKLTNATHCSLFLVSEDGTELIAKAFDGMSRNAEDIRMPITLGFAGHVVTTGTELNISDASNHPLYYKELDRITKFTTRNVLCYPIRDNLKRPIGAIQLCNKGESFSLKDEEATAALADYCGMTLMHSIVYKKIQQSQARSRLTNEVLMYHLAVDEAAILEVTNCTHDHDFQSMIDWAWPCRDTPVQITPCLVLHMFESLGFLDSCRMERSTVARFVLLVKKGYRNVPYHNWMHAFSAAHFSFYVMKQLDVIDKSWITELEGIALFVATLCHDLDHRGTNNAFQTKTKNMLACLYSTEGSILERHHFAQMLCILNTDGANIFENLDSEAFRRVLDLTRELILATDLASHMSRLSRVHKISQSYDPEQKEHRSLLLALIMTAADLSDQIKGWAYTRQVANLIYEEFFTQGDLERAMGYEPVIMMDRKKADIPILQQQFMANVCLQCYKTLAKFFPPLEPCAVAIDECLRKWRIAKKWIDLQEPEGKSPIEFLNDPRLELFVNDEDNE